jgi:hypothetical protein
MWCVYSGTRFKIPCLVETLTGQKTVLGRLSAAPDHFPAEADLRVPNPHE